MPPAIAIFCPPRYLDDGCFNGLGRDRSDAPLKTAQPFSWIAAIHRNNSITDGHESSPGGRPAKFGADIAVLIDDRSGVGHLAQRTTAGADAVEAEVVFHPVGEIAEARHRLGI